MKTHRKIALVLLGYVAAAGIAAAIDDRLHPWSATEDAGMEAGGVVLHFLLLFGVLAMAPTVLAVRFVRPYPSAWDAGVKLSQFAAATGAAALIVFAPLLSLGRAGGSAPEWAALAMLVVGLRLVASLALAAVDLAAALFAPKAEHRDKFFATCLIEGAVFAVGVSLFLYWPRHISP